MISVYIGSDHGGYDLKQNLQKYLQEKGYRVVDLGSFQASSVDYPDVAKEVSEKVIENSDSFGILVCGTGIGMCMTANKIKGIRAANVESQYSAKMSREHNDANVLCLGGRVLSFDLAKTLVDTFLETKFSGEERHLQRIEKIEQ